MTDQDLANLIEDPNLGPEAREGIDLLLRATLEAIRDAQKPYTAKGVMDIPTAKQDAL